MKTSELPDRPLTAGQINVEHRSFLWFGRTVVHFYATIDGIILKNRIHLEPIEDED